MEQTSSPTPEEFGAYLDRLSEQLPDVTAQAIEAAVNRRLAKKLGCKPEEVDQMLPAGGEGESFEDLVKGKSAAEIEALKASMATTGE